MKHSLVLVPIMVVLLVVLIGGYVLRWPWTGYQTGAEPSTTTPETKTLWDWLEVSLLPVTLAFTPVWLKGRDRHRRQWTLALLGAASMFSVLVIGGYRRQWEWTGFAGNTLWDWLRLFLVPFAVPLAFHFLADEERRRAGGDDPGDKRSANGNTGQRVLPMRAGTTAAWVGGIVAADCLLLAAMWVTSEAPRHAAATDIGGPVDMGSQHRVDLVRSFLIDGQDPLWTDTGLSVASGERVLIVGSGWVLPSPRQGYSFVSPDGLQHSHPGQLSIDEHIKHAALIATLAPANRPLALSRTLPVTVFPVGRQRMLTMPRAGELLLGLNDRKTSDNVGSFNATVRVYAPTRPTGTGAS